MHQTIIDLLKTADQDALALGGIGRPNLTFGGLIAQAEATVAALNSRGIGRNDRVAIVLPNGPEMASAFLSVGCGATTAPLNPAYREEELNFYLSDLDAKALLVEYGSTTPARNVAKARNIPVLEIDWAEEDPAGTFRILGDLSAAAQVNGGFTSPDDVPLVLHTQKSSPSTPRKPDKHRGSTSCLPARTLRPPALGRKPPVFRENVLMEKTSLFHPSLR